MKRAPARIPPWEPQPQPTADAPQRGTPRTPANLVRKAEALARLATRPGPVTDAAGTATALGSELAQWGAPTKGQALRLANRLLRKSRK